MKNTKTIRKILFLSNNNIALVVFNTFNNKMNVLYANQVNVNPDSLQPKVNELLTNAANFLNFNIKDVEVVYEDDKLTKETYTNKEFADCYNKEDIAKEIYKKATINNRYVNDIHFSEIQYDDYDKKAIVSCDVCSNDYLTYKKYIKVVEQCNVAVTNTSNVYALLNSNSDADELVLNIKENKVVACKYHNKSLYDLVSFDLNNQIINKTLAKQFNIHTDRVEELKVLANNLIDSDFRNVNIGINYNFITKNLDSIKVNEFISAYHQVLKNEINKFINLSFFSSIKICSNTEINYFTSRKEQAGIGLSIISTDKVAALRNIFSQEKKLSHFSFENSIKLLTMTNKKNSYLI